MGLKPQRLPVLTASANPVPPNPAPTLRPKWQPKWQPSVAALRHERLHLHYGPIDLLIDVDGDDASVRAAHLAAQERFDGVLETLVSELPQLRTPIRAESIEPCGPVAKLMWQACLAHTNHFVTPMAAVAGAVADYVLQAIVQAAPNANRVWVNNGGDIALWLSASAKARVAIFQNNVEHSATITLQASDGVAGIATSGWSGRSHSLGIADAVTVLARTAAAADVAATLIANSVQLANAQMDRHYVKRIAANELQPDSDLTDRAVTVSVSELPKALCEIAVQNGLREARQLMNESSVVGVYIDCQGYRQSLGGPM